MGKVAKLVTVTLTTRVVVDTNATDEQIAEAAAPNLIAKIRNDEVLDNMDEPVEDTTMPFGSLKTDVYYQPDLDDVGDVKGHPGDTIHSFEVWGSKENLMKEFPNCTPIEYSGGDIEDLIFMD